MNLSNRRGLKLQASASGQRLRRRCPIEVVQLEGRLMLTGDITAPVTVAQVVPNTLNGTGYYTASPETVNLLASDPDSPNGLATFYSIDGANFVQGNSFSLINGNHTVQFYSVDLSGNREATRTQAFNIDSTAPVVTATASPNSLFPPNHKPVPVIVSGHVSDASGGVPGVVSYSITDEYNPSHPITGTAPVDASGNYSFVVPLRASRQGQDKDGRLYTIVVTATDQAGNTGAAMTFVVVLHDRGNHSGVGDNGNGNHGHGHGHGHGNHGHGHGGDTGVAPPGSSGGVNQGNGGEMGSHGNGNGNHGNGNGNHGNGNGSHGHV